MNNAKKRKTTIDWERLELSSRKLEITREYFVQNGHNRQNGKGLTELEEIKKCQEYPEVLYKKVLMTQVITVVWSLT